MKLASINREHFVTDLHSRLRRRTVGLDGINKIALIGQHTQSFHWFFVRLQGNLLFDNLAIVLDGEMQLLAGGNQHLVAGGLPGGIAHAIHAGDTVATLDAKLGGRRIFFHPADHRWLIQKIVALEMHHEDNGYYCYRKQHIHRGPGQGNDEALPARMRHELRGIARAGFHRVLARHLDVAAEGQRAHPVVGAAALESE